MISSFNSIVLILARLAQISVLIALVAVSLGMLLWTALASFQIWPWLGLDLSLGGTALDNAGLYVQIGLTALAVGLCAFLPANTRILKLENSHRRFSMGMEDVIKAYQISHQSDRKGVFRLSQEFDAVRERLLHLREHPDLGNLEPEILDIAARMSFQSRDLAKIYSEEKVERAYQFLSHRQEEADQMADRLTAARQTCDELRRWLVDVEAEERLAAQQIKRLESDLFELLPSLGYEFTEDPTVVKFDTVSSKEKQKDTPSVLTPSGLPKRLS